MSRLISRAEAWEKAYEAFNQINFTAFDFDTIKRSLTDYVRLYYPESFNDFIESSEFVAILESFAYIGEQLIYRVDVSSHENFMTVAQRKQSVLRLAKLISYRATRNLPARGLLKITSVSTTEAVFDTRGNALQGTTITWNDIQNVLWKDQFTSILNAASSSNIGTVTPTERVQVDNVLFELYSLNSVYTTRGVLPYNVNVAGTAYPMEVVPVRLDEFGPSERRPENNSAMTFLYGSDGFGNDSPTTGFFMFTKQGRLNSQQNVFDGKTPNQYLDLSTKNINDTDVWINNVDPITGQIVANGDRATTRIGEWTEVDTTSAQNVVFSYTSGRNRYEIESLEDDRARIIFGDGEFANIPSGTFDIWYRVSANENLIIPQNAIVDQGFSIDYLDSLGQRQTLTITASLISNVQNASAAEDIDHIRRVAPATYYSQNRMVSGADYNLFPLKDPSILKLRAINRTYTGESKFSYWHDPSETYENVKMFGDDLIVTMDDNDGRLVQVDAGKDATKVVTNFIAPALASNEVYVFLKSQHVPNVRKTLTVAESAQIVAALNGMTTLTSLRIVYDSVADKYLVVASTPSNYLFDIKLTVQGWIVAYRTSRIVVESQTTNFWSVNNGSVISAETLSAQYDSITILKANLDKNGLMMKANQQFVAKGVVVDSTGLPQSGKLEIVAYDPIVSAAQQGLKIWNDLMDPYYDVPLTSSWLAGSTVRLPFTYVPGTEEITITTVDGVLQTGLWSEAPVTDTLPNTLSVGPNIVYPLRIIHNSMIYQSIASGSTYEHVQTTEDVRYALAMQIKLGGTRTYRAIRGAKGINFMWAHTAPSFHLIDPAATNINDVFVIQRGYYANYLNWLNNLSEAPVPPSALQLRSDYKELLVNAMLSDTVVFHPGKLRLIIGSRAIPELRATILVVKNDHTSLTDSQIKLKIKEVARSFFDISFWEFGETFYFTELSAVIHKELASDVNSVVLVPVYPNHFFGDLFQVNIQEDEIVQADIDIADIEIVSSLNATRLRQFG